MIRVYHGQYEAAAPLLFWAILLDLLDGRIARMTGTTSEFGGELDSLADAISFGVAPAFLAYAWGFSAVPRVGWLAAFLFVVCGALRLARFNVFTGVSDKRFFTGLSIPMAAAVICSSVVLANTLEASRAIYVAMAIGTYLVSLLMVSTFKYWSFKEVTFARRHPAQALLVVVLGIMIVATHPELFLFMIFMGYALSGPVRRLVVGAPVVTQAESAASERP